MAVASRIGCDVMPSSPAVAEGPGPAVSHGGPSITEAVTAVTAATSDDPTCESAATQSEVSLR
jgi:hypothetical protein